MNLFLVTVSVEAMLTGTPLECSEACYLPFFLDTLREPEAKTFPSGKSGVVITMLHPAQQRKPNPPSFHGLVLLFLLEGGMWLHESTCPSSALDHQTKIMTQENTLEHQQP